MDLDARCQEALEMMSCCNVNACKLQFELLEGGPLLRVQTPTPDQRAETRAAPSGPSPEI